MMGRCVPAGVFAGGHDFGHGFLITLRIVFLILFLEAARVFATVTRAALVRRRSWRVRCRTCAIETGKNGP